MSIENADAMFTEVLSIRIDTDQFTYDLAAIGSEWEAAINRMGQQAREAGMDPGDLLNSTAFQADINQIEDQLTRLSSAMGETFGSISDTLVTTMDRAEVAVDRVLTKAEAAKDISIAPASSSHSSYGGFGRAGLLDSIEMVTKWLLLWRLVGAAIDAVGGAIEVLPHALEGGVKYLDDLDNNAVKLRGAIADNVTFSKNLTENFKMAGEAAKYVVQQLQDVADKTQIPFTQLTMAFRALLQGGGASMTTDMSQLVQLTQMFALAMQASGRDVMAARSLISELPKLLNGSVKASSKLLEVLHLTVPQWEHIRQEALRHHDLLAQLEPLLRPYLSAVQDAAFRHSVLSAQLERNKERVEAAFAAPLLEKWNELLGEANSWLTKNDTATKTLASDTGRLAVSIANLFTGQTSDGLKSIVVALDAFINGLNILVTVLGVAKRELVDFDSVAPLTEKVLAAGSDILHGRFSKAGSDIEGIKSYVKGQYQKDVKEILDSVAEAESSLGTVMYGSSATQNNFQFQGGSQGVNPNAQKEAAAAAKDRLAAIRSEFIAERDLLRQNTQEAVDEIKEGVSQRKISVQEGTKQLIAVYNAEAHDMRAAVKEFSEAAALTGAKPSEVSKLQFLMGFTGDNVALAAQRAESQARQRAAKDAEAIESEKNRSIEALAIQHERQMLAILKQQAAEGLATHQQVARAEIELDNQVYEARAKALESQYSAAGANVLEQTKALDALKALTQEHQAAQQKHNQDLSKARLEDQKDSLAMQQEQVRAAMDEAQAHENGMELLTHMLPLQQKQLQLAQAHVEALKAAGVHGRELAKAMQAVADISAQISGEQQSTDFFGRRYDATTGKYAGHANLLDTTRNLQDVFSQLARTVKETASAFEHMGALGVIGAAASGVGGILSQANNANSGIGSLFKTLGLSGEAFGAVGAGLGIAGDMVSMISGIFQQAARDIANQIELTFRQIMQKFQYDSNATLTETITQLQQARQQAIERLSGTKGGDKYLTQIEQQFDQQLMALAQQQQKTLTDFRLNLQELADTVSTGNDVMAKSFEDWNKTFLQAKQALGAGESPKQVQEFLNLTLKQQELSLQKSLNQGEQDAIQANFKLNDLTMQREQILLEIQQLDHSAMDSIERRQAGAVSNYQRTKLQREELKNQLDNVNQQITVQQHTVDVVNRIYGITSNLTDLHKLDAQLQEQAISWQMSQYISMKHLLESLLPLSAQIFGPNKVGFAGGGYLGTAGEGAMPGVNATAPVTNNITVHVGPGENPTQTGEKIANSIVQELELRARSGRFIA